MAEHDVEKDECLSLIKDGILTTHMLAIFLVYKGDCHHLLDKYSKEENSRMETEKRQINQWKKDNKKT